jgi:hypothetical protein
MLERPIAVVVGLEATLPRTTLGVASADYAAGGRSKSRLRADDRRNVEVEPGRNATKLAA